MEIIAALEIFFCCATVARKITFLRIFSKCRLVFLKEKLFLTGTD